MKLLLKTSLGKTTLPTSVTLPAYSQPAAPPHPSSGPEIKARCVIETPAGFSAPTHDFFPEFEPFLPGPGKPTGLVYTYLYRRQWRPLGVLAHEVLPHQQEQGQGQGMHAAEGMPRPASLPLPEQRPEPAVCPGHPGLAPPNYPPAGPRASHERLGGRVYPRASSGETGRTGRNGRTGKPGTVVYPGSASACGSRRELGALTRQPPVPGCRRESDQSAKAGCTQHRVSRTVAGRRCR